MIVPEPRQYRYQGVTETILERAEAARVFGTGAFPEPVVDTALDYAFPEDKVWNPVQWAYDHGIELWSKTIEMLEALMENDKVAVYSCHTIGKSFTAARVVILSWVDTFGHESLTLFTGPDHDRVHNVMGKELRDGVTDMSLEDIEVLENDHIKYQGSLRGFGRKPPDHKDNGFSGIHALRPLVVIDEGCHVPKWMYDSASTITSNMYGKTLVLGNPDNPHTHFRNIKRDPEWTTIVIPANETPNFTGEKVSERLRASLITPKWAEARKKEWGEKSPLYLSKVMAEFPTEAEDQIISFDLIDQAFTEVTRDRPRCLVLDVASSGKDEAVAYSVQRNGDFIVEFSYSKSDLMDLADEAAAWWRKHTGAFVVVDANGQGEGVWSRLKQLGVRVRAFLGQKAARAKDIFKNRRAEAAFCVERAIRNDEIRFCKSDEILRGELPTLIKEQMKDDGKWKLMSKEDMAKRGLASPNRADCVCMAVWELGLGAVKQAAAGFASKSIPMVAAGGYAG